MSETKKDKWERGKTLFLESVYKPDDKFSEGFQLSDERIL